MEQHPVPQQISSYQFHLVGDMTLKQFFEVAGGVVVAVLLYASGLPGFFKWPLIVFAVITGAALAFFPLEERPLEIWIIAFFRSIYSPTAFFWSKPAVAQQYFALETAATTAAAAQQPAAPPSTGIKAGFLEKLEEGEKIIFSRFTSLYQQNNTPSPTPVSTPVGTIVTEQSAPAPIPQVAKPTQATAIPAAGVVNVQKSVEPVSPDFATIDNPQQPIASSPLAQTLRSTPLNGATVPQMAQFSQSAAPPIPPTDPNIIVGQVFDSQGNIIEGAILEVKDMQGRPVRALRSNKVGHFQIVTPLITGKYELVAEKPGYEFETVTFETTGLIVPPIAVHAKQIGGVVTNAN